VQREIKRLLACGILKVDRQRFFTANRDSPVYAPLAELILRTSGLVDRLRQALVPMGDEIAVASVFGSFARREQHVGSDVDLLIVVKNEHCVDTIHERLTMVQSEIAREINPFVLTVADLARKSAAGNPFVSNLLSSKMLFVIGDEDELKRLAQERLAQTAQTDKRRTYQPARVGRPRSGQRKSQRT
jgi:predicted nucleotidyltransferase